MIEKVLTIQNAQGFHLRPAQLFVEQANRFRSELKLKTDSGEIDPKSILGLMTLGLSQGSSFTIEANGEDELEAVQTLAELVESGFGEI